MSPHAIVKLGFLDQEVHHPLSVILGVQDDRRKIVHPLVDGVVLIAALQQVIIGLLLFFDDLGERNQSRRAERLRQDFLGQTTRDTAVPVLERMVADEIKMSDARADERRQSSCAPRRRVVEPAYETRHFALHAFRGRRFEMYLRLVVRPGDDLHGLVMGAITADDGNIGSACHDHCVPGKQNLVG